VGVDNKPGLHQKPQIRFIPNNDSDYQADIQYLDDIIYKTHQRLNKIKENIADWYNSK
jgi:hypothetical protein